MNLMKLQNTRNIVARSGKLKTRTALKKKILPVCDAIFLIFNFVVVVVVFNMCKYKSVLFSWIERNILKRNVFNR